MGRTHRNPAVGARVNDPEGTPRVYLLWHVQHLPDPAAGDPPESLAADQGREHAVLLGVFSTPPRAVAERDRVRAGDSFDPVVDHLVVEELVVDAHVDHAGTVGGSEQGTEAYAAAYDTEPPLRDDVPPSELVAALLDAMALARRSRRPGLAVAAQVVADEAERAGVEIGPEQAEHLARMATSWRWRARHPRRWARYRFRRTLDVTG